MKNLMTICMVVFVVGADLLGAEWAEKAKLTASDGADDDWFGYSVSVSGGYAIVGASLDDDNGSSSGSAYIFKREGGIWSEQDKLLASDGAAGEWFGASVSISGDYAIVGAWGGLGPGSAYIFAPNEVDPNNWEQVAKLTASDGAAGDCFGHSVSISGDYAIVGANRDDDSTGSAYVFKREGESWSELDKLTASDGTNLDQFGYSVSISGDYAIIGAWYDDDKGSESGSAYIFTPNEVDPNNWDQVAKLVASDGAAMDLFGVSVSISGDYAIVGAYGDDDNGPSSGSAYIFKREGEAWSEQAKLTASDGAYSDWFGESVSISGDYALVGAYWDDDRGSESGSAYVFKREGTSWNQQDKWRASDDLVEGDYFGGSVCVSGYYAIVGAYNDDYTGSNFGSAYMFDRCPDSDSTEDCFVDLRDLSVMGDEWLTGDK